MKPFNLSRACSGSFFLLITLLVCCQPLQAQHRLGLGINYGGVQIDYLPSARWMFETRFQKATDTTTAVTRSTLMGLRLYRLLYSEKKFSPFLGLEAAFIKVQQNDSDYDASGQAVGAFGGLRIKITSHFLMNMDMGPYFIALTEKRTKANTTSVDFVGDAALIYLF